jgi:hypothetical protein
MQDLEKAEKDLRQVVNELDDFEEGIPEDVQKSRRRI